MKKFFLKSYLTGVMLFWNIILFAQGGSFEDDEGNVDGNVEEPEAPINSKLFLLALIGIAFAWYYLSKNRRVAKSV